MSILATLALVHIAASDTALAVSNDAVIERHAASSLLATTPHRGPPPANEVRSTVALVSFGALNPSPKLIVPDLDPELRAWAEQFAREWMARGDSVGDPHDSTGQAVIWAMSLPVRKHVGYGATKARDSDGNIIELHMGEKVELCLRDPEDRRHPKDRVSVETRINAKGEKERLRWFYVAREGESCENALGWIPQYTSTEGRCRNFGKPDGPTCWDFWNWATKQSFPKETTETECPEKINQIRRKYASMNFPGRQIGADINRDDAQRCAGTAFIGATGGAVGGGITTLVGKTPGIGSVVRAGVAFSVSEVAGTILLTDRASPERTTEVTAWTTAGTLFFSGSVAAATVAGTLACLGSIAYAKANEFSECRR